MKLGRNWKRLGLKSEWKKCTVGEIASVQGGKRLPKGANLIIEPNSHPYIRIRDLTKKRLELNQNYEYVDNETQKSISKYIVNSGDILISIVGTIGLVAIVGDTLQGANLTENCAKIIDINKNVDREYLYYFLISDYGKQEINKGTVGAVQPKLPIKNIQSIKVFLPPLDIQKQISQLLTCIDDKIAINTTINNNLEQQAQAIFKSWFVDFKPFGGVMPDDWNNVSLDQITEMSAGGDKPKNTTSTLTNENKVPIYSNGLTDEGLYGFTNKAKIFEESVTVSARGTIGYVCLRQTPYVPIVRLITLIPHKEKLSAKYLYMWLKQLHILGTGTTQQQLTVPDFGKTKITLPTADIIEKFTEAVNPLFNKIFSNKLENQHLSALRDTLLPKLMNGEIDVSNVKI